MNAASPGDADHVFIRAAQVPPDRHAERRAEGRAGVAGAVAIVLAFGAQQEAIEPVVLAHGFEAVAAAGEQLVDVALMADVEDELVLWRIEDPMQRDGQFHHAEIRPKVAAHGCGVLLGEHADEFVPHFLGELREIFSAERL